MSDKSFIDLLKEVGNQVYNPNSEFQKFNHNLDHYVPKELIAANSAKMERENAMVTLLEEIARNTSNLHELVSLVRQGNEVNEKMFELFQEISLVMKANTKEEAEDIIRDVLEKAQQAKESIDTIQWLINYGKMLIKLAFPDVDL